MDKISQVGEAFIKYVELHLTENEDMTFVHTSSKAYKLSDVKNEILQNSNFGKTMESNILNLAIDLLVRKVKKIEPELSPVAQELLNFIDRLIEHKGDRKFIRTCGKVYTHLEFRDEILKGSEVAKKMENNIIHSAIEMLVNDRQHLK